jgi:lysozyme
MMFASTRAIEEIKLSEGYRHTWYRCPAGKWTIGYGHVKKPGDSYGSLSRAEAEAILLSDLTFFARDLVKLLKRTPTQGQFDGMISLVYNTGVGIQDGKKGDFADSDLLAKFNKGDIKGAADQFLLWCKYRNPATGNLEVLDGLLKRRQRERAIFLELV